MKYLTPLFLRLSIFVILFITLTGLIGSWIIGNKLLYSYYFYIYPNMGKMIIFSIILFILLTRSTLPIFKLPPYNRLNLIFIALAFVFTVLFSVLQQLLLQTESFTSSITLSLVSHAVVVSVPIFLILGCFGTDALVKFWQLYRKQILICLGVSIVFYFAIFQVWKLWPYLSDIVLRAVHFLFSLTFEPVVRIPPRALFVKNFVVSIEEACSGVDSLFLFSTLYICIGTIDWKKFHKLKLILMFFPAVIGLFLVNILRVYLLILIGVLTSPQVTIQLFHTYLGMILFIIYFTVFWKFTYRWMMK